MIETMFLKKNINIHMNNSLQNFLNEKSEYMACHRTMGETKEEMIKF